MSARSRSTAPTLEPRGPGRPRDPERSERRRRDLVAAGYEVMRDHGYAAAGVADIARRAGLSPAAFYRHFKSKRELADHVVDHAMTSALETLRGDSVPDAATNLDEFEALLRSIAERAFELFERQPALARLVLFEYATIDEAARQRAFQLLERARAFTASYLEHGVDLGFLRAGLDTEAISEGALALIAPVILSSVAAPASPARRRRYINAMVDLVISGVRP